MGKRSTFKFTGKSTTGTGGGSMVSTRLRLLFQNQGGSDTVNSVEVLKSAASVIPLLVHSIIGPMTGGCNILIEWDNLATFTVLPDPDLLDELGDMHGLETAFGDVRERLAVLRQFAELSASEFQHLHWVESQPPGGIDRCIRAFKLATSVKRHHCLVTLGNEEVSIPDISFQTTRLLPQFREATVRVIDLHIPDRSGKMLIVIGDGRTRTVSFRCAAPEVFKVIQVAATPLVVQYQPTIDLLSQDDGQLALMEIAEVRELTEGDQPMEQDLQI